MSARTILKTILPAALLLAAPVLRADDHPNNDRGFSADKAFQVGDIDNVNLFNGNLVLTIPLGGSYPAGGGLSYGLTLVYNSNVWDFQERYEAITDQFYTQALPRRTSNAGLGWTVSLGRLVDRTTVGNDIGRLTYHGADGAEHVFYPTLHEGDEDEPGDSKLDPVVAYTRDGSYLRYRMITFTNRVVEFPDGQVHHFDDTGQLTRIEDRFGNYLDVTYGFLVWILKDGQNRMQEIHFKGLMQDGKSFEVVDYIKLTAFDPANGSATATYTFNYAPMFVARPCPYTDPKQSSSVQVQQLSSVTLPDGSSYQIPDYVADVGSTGPGCRSSGVIRSLTLPTLAQLSWTWQEYTFPSQSGKLYRQKTSGVATRKKVGAAGENLGTWTYATSLGSPVNTGLPPVYAELTNTLTDPLGHRTVRYFSVYSATSFVTSWSRNDYSLPFSRNYPDGAGRFLSSQTFASGSATAVRSTYVLYERDQTPTVQISNDEFQDALNVNRRQRSTRTVYHDDGDRYADSDATDFDGLGHYRSETTGGSFGAGNVRSATTSFNPERRTYIIDPSTNQPAPGHDFSMLPSTSPWLLETFKSRQVTEGGVTDRSIYCFDETTGFLLRKRQLKNSGTAESANDLLAVYTPNGGNIQTEQYFGGDNQNLAANNTTCSMALPSTPAYQIDHTYQYGVRATSQYSGAPFLSLDQTIEPRTGLVWKSRDTAGLETAYAYDPMGRLTWAMPSAGNGAWTEYVYDRALSAASLAKVTVKRRANGSQTGTVRTQSQILFDSLGRVWQEKQLLPSGSWNTRETLYDLAGNKASVSEVQTGTPNQKTQFQSYDPFGRAKTIVPPDGAAHKLTLNYYGVRVVERSANVGTTYSAGAVTESAATTTEVYDRQGRLWKVTEPSGASNADVTTTYSYDVGNRLRQVSTTATVSGSSVTQNRFFTYDNRGFLSSETHPEKGASGNGTVTYSGYDARGHAGRTIDGPNDLSFTYDAAERLTQVKETGGSGRVLKAFSYAAGNGANDWRQGKLRTATRYNYVSLNAVPYTVQVDETYSYGGRDGRVSQRDTSAFMDGSVVGSFTQSFTYNDLGLVSSLGYPRCTHAFCTQLPAPSFTDVPAGHEYRPDIEAIYPNITSGCTTTTPPAYCPDSFVTRGQMAVFLIRAKMGPNYVPVACQGLFADMPCSQNSPYVTWAEEMLRQGITAGCETDPVRKYCPDQNVTNAQMAVFVLQTMGVGTGTTEATCTVAPYPDVLCSHWAVRFITEESRRKIAIGCSAGFCPDANVTRKEMARLMVRAFDIPLALDPNTQRTVQFTYSQGLLSTVAVGGTTYGTLSYHPNLMVSQIVRNNGITDTQANDPNEMRRPAALAASGSSYQASWSSGTYGYDGAGNIKTLGVNWFTYDKFNRLVNASINDGPTGLGAQKQQTYTFDPFGNLTNIAGSNGRNTPTAAQTNRLNGTGTAYDAAGNLTNWNLAVYEYDRFNQMVKMTSGSEQAAYFYTADDERLWSYDLYRNVSHWTLRDLGGKVLRDYQDNGRWTLFSDYLYRDGLLLAAETQTGQRHFHLDHLGTPRLITRGSGFQAAYHAYFPFGEEATATAQDAERMKFTGHERDLANPAVPGDDLDYMHARHESPVTGRFLSVDPAGISDLRKPQGWNRYTYARGNPMLLVDPDGRVERTAWQAGTVVNESTQPILIAADINNKVVIIQLNPGEKSDDFFEDTDAIIVKKGQAIDGERTGAFKIGPADLVVQDSDEGEGLTIDRDGEYPIAYVAGRAGYKAPEEAKESGWVEPKDKSNLDRDKASRREIRKEEKKRKVKASSQNSDTKTSEPV